MFFRSNRKKTATGAVRRTYRLTVEPLEDRIALSSDAVLDWNAVMLEANAVDHSLAAPDQGGPTRTARAFAIVHAAIYDAVNGIERTHEPYLVQLRAPRGSNMDAAIAGAAFTTLSALFPQQRATFRAELVDALAEIPNGLGEIKGLAYGAFVGLRMLGNRLFDGSQVNMPYTPGTDPGDHNVDPLHPDQGFLDPLWGGVRPFTLLSADQFQAPPPPDLASAEYAAAYNEVYVVGAVDAEMSDRDNNNLPDRTAEQREIGIYWGYDGSPGLGTPPRLYNQITREVALQAGNTEVQNARLFALVNLAQADAGIACWEVKYEFDFWRPILGIRGGDLDGNPDTPAELDWAPLGAPRSNDPGPNQNFTPPFPAYTSGHATFGAATFQVLANFYGSDTIPGGSLTFISDEFNGVTVDQDGTVRPVRPRTFDTFSEMAEENGQSRIYLGIHWSFDKTEGIAHGNQVGDWVFDNFLEPLQTGKSSGGGGGASRSFSPASTGLGSDIVKLGAGAVPFTRSTTVAFAPLPPAGFTPPSGSSQQVRDHGGETTRPGLSGGAFTPDSLLGLHSGDMFLPDLGGLLDVR